MVVTCILHAFPLLKLRVKKSALNVMMAVSIVVFIAWRGTGRDGMEQSRWSGTGQSGMGGAEPS